MAWSTGRLLLQPLAVTMNDIDVTQGMGYGLSNRPTIGSRLSVSRQSIQSLGRRVSTEVLQVRQMSRRLRLGDAKASCSPDCCGR